MPLDRRSVEARLGEREPQIVEGFVAVSASVRKVPRR